jgi:hypothetical protein
MLPQEKGTIIEIDHKVTRGAKVEAKRYDQAIVDIKINIFTDDFYYTDKKHREMIEELQKVIRKYI